MLRSTLVAEEPVYFEVSLELPDGVTDADASTVTSVNLDGENEAAVLTGGNSTVDAGESVDLALGDNGMGITLFRTTPAIESIPFASGETSVSVGEVRIGVAYTPATGVYTIHAWTTEGGTFQYPTASDVASVVQFGPYNLHPAELTNHFSVTTGVLTSAEGVVCRIVTDEADFSNPEGKPDGYVDLASAAGGDTAPHTLPFLANSPY